MVCQSGCCEQQVSSPWQPQVSNTHIKTIQELTASSAQFKQVLKKVSTLQADAYETFKFPMATVVFTHPEGTTPAKANM